MKRTITLLIATALILGMSQCKKNVETITPSDLGEAVYITVNVDDGGKHIVYPGTGAYVFENGDKLYVGNNGKYRGTLTYNSGAFSGTINSPSTNDYLHFYFVGGLTPSATPSAGNTTSFTVNIANQSSKLPVLSYAHSTQKYVDGTTTYGCTLLNKCGLVKFVPATGTAETVRVGGMKTTATINFATGSEGITPTGATGNVTLYSESSAAKWAILLVQGEVSTPPVTIAGYNSTITSVPAVTENYYNKDGVSIAMTMLTPPEGAAGGTANARHFSVSGDKHVWFSQGNLQYNKETGKFSFMEHQYSTVETTGQNVGDDYANQNIVSLFGWGTTGYQDTRTSSTGYQTNYYPYSTSNTEVGSSTPAYNINRYGYGPDYDSSNKYGLTVANKSDWGMHAITNGGNTAGMWRTLTMAEWEWVLGPNNGANPGTNCRTSSTVNNVQNARFAKATVNSKAGVIIFPDNYTHPSGVTQPTNINGYTSDYTGNSYNTTQWSSMESAGAVFLPAAGYRNGTSVFIVGSYGGYWSSTASSVGYAYNVGFGSSNFIPSHDGDMYYGYSVRLVIACE